MITTTSTALAAALRDLPVTADEPTVESRFIESVLLNALGFNPEEACRQFKTGVGGKAVDYALRKTIDGDRFLHTQANPYLLIEAKGQDTNLQENAPGYRSTVRQLKGYLADPNCHTVQWGMITNAQHIQLFRKHGKVIHPATVCRELTPETVDSVVAEIRHKLENPVSALTVAVYANKGGVGKTSTTLNLAAVLGHAEKKRVLVIDFDPNQRDLTNSLCMPPSEGEMFNILADRDADIRSAIRPYCIERKGKTHYFFDILPADKRLLQVDDNELRRLLKLDRLKQKLATIGRDYDYILIDCSPNWTLFSQLAMVAADVVLTPVGFNNLSALRNVAVTVKQYLSEAQSLSGDGSPIQLPIFFNGGKATDKNKLTINEAIEAILKESKVDGFDLREIFYPKSTNAKKNHDIFEIPNYANIAGAVFAGIPASYQYKTANEYYRKLAKEYFLP